MGKKVVGIKFVRYRRFYAQGLGQASGRLGGEAENIGAVALALYSETWTNDLDYAQRND
jgi:hypothetical protein